MSYATNWVSCANDNEIYYRTRDTSSLGYGETRTNAGSLVETNASSDPSLVWELSASTSYP